MIDKRSTKAYKLEKENRELKKEIELLKKCYCERTDCAGRLKNSMKFPSIQEELFEIISDKKAKDEFDQIYGFDKGLLFYKDSGTIILPWNNQDTALDVLYDLIKADMVEKVEE